MNPNHRHSDHSDDLEHSELEVFEHLEDSGIQSWVSKVFGDFVHSGDMVRYGMYGVPEVRSLMSLSLLCIVCSLNLLPSLMV